MRQSSAPWHFVLYWEHMKPKKLVPFPKKYFNMMPPPAVVKILKEKPYLTWWVKDKDSLNLPAATEAILNYGDWDECKTLFRAAGIETVKRIFRSELRGRNDYDDQVSHFFNSYFKRHAP